MANYVLPGLCLVLALAPIIQLIQSVLNRFWFLRDINPWVKAIPDSDSQFQFLFLFQFPVPVSVPDSVPVPVLTCSHLDFQTIPDSDSLFLFQFKILCSCSYLF